MKAWKTFGYLFVYPVLLLGTGFLGGALFVSHFYPGVMISEHNRASQVVESAIEATVESAENKHTYLEAEKQSVTDDSKQQEALAESEESGEEPILEVLLQEETLNADTMYVLEEMDLRSNSVVETRWSLPTKYIGMDREEFIEAMEVYEASPPLEELERGFVSLEVLAFSAGEVVVQMNYEYMQPGSSFYLMVRDNYVVVCLEDMQTVYMETDILLKELPEEMQQDIIQVMYVPDEESLYDFLENYSS